MSETLIDNQKIIDIQDIFKIYRLGEIEVRALRGVSMAVEEGEFLSIMGPSGSGKSTLMNIIGCLDQPTSGEYFLDGADVSRLKDDQLAEIRNRKIGFVFQTFNLLPRTPALQQVELPLIYSRDGDHRRHRATEALTAVGLADRLDHKPNELSGGQQQRVAIARSLINRPSILLADEPTGNLDSKSGKEIMAILQRLNREQDITVVMVTHDPMVSAYSNRIIRLQDGQIVAVEQVEEPRIAIEEGVEA